MSAYDLISGKRKTRIKLCITSGMYDKDSNLINIEFASMLIDL